MKFCTITPIAGLEKWGTVLSNHHLILAQLLYNEKYMEYYSIRRQAGDFIILDNGTYENSKPMDEAAYYNYIKGFDPTVAVLPDLLMQPWLKTTSTALKFLDKYADQLAEANYRTQWMYVPQIHDGSFDDFCRSVSMVLLDGRQGHHVTWIGLGRYLSTEWGIRVKCATWVKSHYPHLRLHALGMAAGSLDELKALKDVGVNSIDSSAPVWRGWNNQFIHENQVWAKTGTPCDFHAKLPPIDCEAVIQTNLKAVQNVLNS